MKNNYLGKTKALAIIETIASTVKGETQREALEAVADWIKKAFVNEDIIKMTPEERMKRIEEILKKRVSDEPKHSCRMNSKK